MRRVFLVLIVAMVVLALAWALASLPGHVSGDVGNTTFEAPTSVVALGLLVLFALIFAVLRLFSAMVRLPRAIRDRQARRRRVSGDLAVTQTLLALAAGETGDARREASRARRLLGDTPATLLLAAEAGRMAGRTDEAEAAFQTLADRSDAAFLGLRGLLRQAIDRADWTAAMALAQQAEVVQPGAAWLRRERARLAVRAGEWNEALSLADADAPRAALATAAADAAVDPKQARRLARRAWQEDPALAPAALAYAKRLRDARREVRALAVIRHSWSIAPQPQLAEFVLAPVGDPLARPRVAHRLTEANPTHAESRLVLARAALEAGLTGEARHHAEAAVQAGVNERRFWLLLAEIAELEGGDQREALRGAATADPDPVWRCEACHTAHADWHPACPDCFTVGSLRWSAVPAEGPPTLRAHDETFLISSG